MRFTLIKYSLREAYLGLRRQLLMSTLATLTIAVSMLIVGIFLLIISNLNHLRTILGKEIGIIVFLHEDLPADKVSSLIKQIKTIPQVESVTYISKEKALAEFATEQEIKREIELLGFNPLPPTLEVKTKHPFSRTLLAKVAYEISKLPEVDSVDYGEDWIDRLSYFLHFVQFFAILLGAVVSAVAVFIVSNTLRFVVHNRKDEIEIMKLVGASDWLIQGPFLLEGIAEGFLGSAFSLFLLYLLYHFFLAKIGVFAFISNLQAIILVIAGILLGAAGAYLSLQRYLKV